MRVEKRKKEKTHKISYHPRNTLTKTCSCCHQVFVSKYWDSELDWYIELNNHATCRECQQKKG